MATEKVINTMAFPGPAQAQAYLKNLGAGFRRNDERGFPLYKTPAGIVFRVVAPTKLEILANCAC